MISLHMSKTAEAGQPGNTGLASFPIDGSYTKILRGYFLSHPEKHQNVWYRSCGENGILSDAIDFEILDEHYFVSVDEADTNVFLRSESVDGESIAGSHHRQGKGKVICVTPAHNQEGLQDPLFLKLLGSCVNWGVE
ncbi:hypothetical protein [Peribacillus kribbensis]|uniref:hypothetical protein n=1 Tax=Peribacillus kribbensis TaxID=356658 RepID=UPI0006841ECB|nr:hypothetical protein [Peribacillus kribbensis]